MSKCLDYDDYDDSDEYDLCKNKLYKISDAELEREGVSGITRRALDASNVARELSYVISTLRAVNMDRLANQVESVQIGIINLLEPIPRMVNTDVQKQIDHGHHMLSGVLQLALTKDIIPKNQTKD